MVPLVKPFMAPRQEMMPAVEQVLYSGYLAMGESVNQFEKEFGKFVGNPHVLAMNSGTAALHTALSLLRIGPGDEVISTAMTAEPTNIAIAVTGAKIVWADVDINTGLLDPQSVREKITERTKAVMLVHYAGMVCDMDAFNALSAEYHIPIIEDAAHALGSRYNGNWIGMNAPYTCFSFQAIKHMTTVDGGALVLKDAEKMKEAEKLRWFGLDRSVGRLENNIERAGYKYGMNNVNAVIGTIQLRHMEEVIGRHKSNGKFYDSALRNIPGVTLIPYYENTEPSYWLYTLKVENRTKFIEMMEQRGIAASPLHHRNDTHSVFFESRCELPDLDKFYEEFVHIPCGWWVDDEIREKTAAAIRKGW